jgi:hypothetical protein
MMPIFRGSGANTSSYKAGIAKKIAEKRTRTSEKNFVLPDRFFTLMD